VEDVRQPDFQRKVPGAADNARAITIGTTAKSAAAGIPPAAAELAVIEEDRSFRSRMKKAPLRRSLFFQYLRQSGCPPLLDPAHNVFR
jgi:hypothetical protein